MAKNKPSVRKKPTNKEIASVLIEINRKVTELANGVNEAFSVLRQLDSIIGMYVDMNGNGEEFNAYIAEKQKEAQEAHDAEKDGKPDSENISEDTGDEGRGTEGVREKE